MCLQGCHSLAGAQTDIQTITASRVKDRRRWGSAGDYRVPNRDLGVGSQGRLLVGSKLQAETSCLRRW